MLVFMAQHVADGGDLRPRNFRVPGLELVTQTPAGLGDDFNATLDEPALALVRFKGLKGRPPSRCGSTRRPR